MGVAGVGEDCGEPEEGGEDDEDAGCSVQPGAAVEVKEEAAGEELQDRGADENLD